MVDVGGLGQLAEWLSQQARTSSQGKVASEVAYTKIPAKVGTIRRLRVTKGVCLPADIAIHGVFGSKDVIHS